MVGLPILKVGDRSYRLGRAIGGGAHSTVFSATDDGGRLCAVKKVAPRHPRYRRLIDAGAHEISHHASVAGLFDDDPNKPHPGIVLPLNAFPYGADYYIVMEHCNGSLHDLVRRPLGGPGWVLPVARPVLSALDWMHERGNLHTDLHPGNVLFLQDARKPEDDPASYTFKLSDFSLADRWSSGEDDEDPAPIQDDIDGAACVLASVALLSDELSPDMSAVLRALPPAIAEPIVRAREGGFCGEFAARDFLRALEAAAE
jgi:serine/threonine protein kinase